MAEGTQFPQFIVLREDPGNAQVYDQFVRKMADAGNRAKDSLSRSMSGVRDTIAEALAIPRNAGGSLDLNIAQLREMERQSEAVARATREYALASKQAAISSGENSRARNQEIRAAFELARAEESSLAALRTKIRVLDQVQAELNQTASATDAVVTATRRGTDAWGIHANSMRGSRQAMVQTGQQLQDVAISLYGGQRASVVFAQQIPQLTFALTSLEGSANKTAAKIGSMATLLSGPWSLAVVAGAAVLGYLVDQLFNTEDSAKKGGSAMEGLTDKLDLSKNSYEALIAVVNEYNDAQSKGTAKTYDAIKAAYALAEANLKLAESKLALFKGDTESSITMNAGSATEANAMLAQRDSTVAYLQGEVDRLRKDLNAAGVALGTEESRRNNDPRYKLETSYGNQLSDLDEKRKKGLIEQIPYEQQRTKLLQQQTKALEAWDAAHRKSGKSSEYSGSRDLSEFGAPVTSGRISSGYGTRVAPTKGASTNHLGIDYAVPVGTPVYATQGGVIKFAGSVDGYGNQIQLNHGGGTQSRYSHLSRFAVGSGQQVNKGDLIGYSGKTGTVTGPHLHYEVLVNGKKVDPTKGKFPFDAANVAEEAQKAADALQEFGDRSAEKISRINEAFDEQPRLIDRANQATRELDATIAELTERKPEGWQQLVADAQAAKGTIQDALVRPFREMREESEKRITVQRLLTAGREDEAEALDRIWSLEKSVGPLTAERKQEVLSLVRYEREVNEELAARQEIINSYLDATRSVKQELVSIFSGDGSFANLGKIFRNLQGQVIVEKLFGNAFRDFDKWVKGESGLADSVDYFTAEADNAGAAAGNLASALNGAASVIRNPALSEVTNRFDSLSKAVNDNFFAGTEGAEITVKGAVPGKDSAMGMTPERYFAEMSKQVVDPLLGGLDSIFGVKFFGKLSGALSGAMNGYLTGGPAGGILGALKGIEGLPAGLSNLFGKGLGGSQTGTMVAGLGNALGIKLNSTGAQIGGAIGSMLPIPGGEIIGSIAGGLIGNLVGKRPRGAAEVSNSSVYGHTNDSALTDSISGWGGQVQDAVKSIADALGAEIGAYSIGLGRYKDYYQVSSKAGDPRLGNSYFGRDSQNAVYDGLDAEAAMAAAIGAVLAQGAIKGISAASQKILTSAASKDLQAAIEKAVLIESIPKRLKRLTDPVGSAIDELNKEFEKMVAALKEGGATAEQFADAQKLYDLERAAAIEQATASVTNSLRSLLDELTVGNDALALRDRRSAALAAYDPLRARVAAGDTTAYDKFAEAARSLLDIERQMFGSQSGYFDRLNEVTGLTRTALAAQEALIAGSTGAPSPFSSAANDNVVSSLDAQTGVLQGGFDTLAGQLAAVNQNLGTLIQLNLAAGGSTLFTPGGVVNY